MSVLMIACFMPAAAFAASSTDCAGDDDCKHVASITSGDETTHYGTLAEAITAAAADNIITLLSDVTADSTIIAIPEGKTVVIDLNGKDISSSTGCAIVNKGNLTISGSGNVSTTAEGSAAIANFPDAVANVNGGTYVSSNWYVIKNMGKMTIDGDVEVKKPENSVNTSSLIDNGWVTTADTVAGESVSAQANKAELTIKNGEFSGKAGLKSCSVVKNDDYGELTISGGTFDSTNNTGQNNATTILNWHKATISGGTFVGQYPISNGAYTYESDKGEFTITGGTFTGVKRIFGKGEGGNGKGTVTVAGGSFTAPEIGGNYAEEVGGYTLSIAGGTFSTDPSAYLADNRIVRFENGKYEVEPFDAYKAGITLAPLVDKSDNPITDLEEDYGMIWDGDNVAINFKPQLHTNGAGTLGKWVGIAVPVPEGAKTVDYKYSDKDLVKGVSLEGEVWENASGKKFISFYWDYATRFVTSLSYKFDNVGNTNTVDITVNGYPTEIIKAPLHDASGSIADNNLCSKYEIDHEAGAAIITVKGLKAHENASGNKGKWVGIAVPANYKTGEDTKLIYRYKDGDEGAWGSWQTAELTSEVWEKDGKKYVSFYMDSEKVSVRWISYSFGTLTAGEANKDGVEVTGVNDVRVEVKVENVSSGGGSSSSKATTTDNVTSTTGDKTGSTTASTTATVKSETKTNTDGTKTTTATVDTTTASDIVKKTVENKSEEVVVNTTTTTAQAVTETAAGTTTEVALPEQTVRAIANETEAAVTIKSDAAEVKLDKEAVKAVAEQAGDAGTVSLVVETVAQSESKVEVDLRLVTSKGNVTEFKGGSVSVTVKLNAALAAKPVVCVYIDNFGTYHKVSGQKNADGTYTFVTGHFSSYAVMAEDDADKVIAEQTENVEKLVSDLTLKARSQKTEKGSIKVTLTADEDAIRQIEDLGYTVKYKFYRSTKKAASYKAKYEKAGLTYTNTAGTKGTRYYYKARVMVYDAQGALIAKTELKQCKYACRIK